MDANSRGPVVLRLLLLFFVPLISFVFLFLPQGDGILPAFVSYVILLFVFSGFAAVKLSTSPAARTAVTLGLVVGMFLVHLVVGVGGCTLLLVMQ